MASIGHVEVATLKRVIGVALLLLANQRVGIAQSRNSAEKSQVQVVDFCEMMNHPDSYHDKTVRVSAMYAANSEGAVFFDDNCKKSESQPNVVASAKFTGSREEIKRSLKEIQKASNKKSGVPQVVRVTMIAVFRDNYAPTRSPVCLTCLRYALEVNHLLNVER